MPKPLLIALVVLLALLLAPAGPGLAEGDPAPAPGAADAPPEPPKAEDEEEEGDDEEDDGGLLEAPGDDETTAPGTGPKQPTGPTYRQRGPVRVLRDEGTPAGMVRVPGGVAVIGTKAKRLAELLQGRPDTIKERFQYELPQHARPMASFFIDEFEVSNAQYLAFLMDKAHVVHTTAGQLANLEEVAGHLLRLPQSEWSADRHSFWRQLYEANKTLLHEKMPDLVVKNAGGQIDEEKTARAFRRAPLARGLELEFYTIRPPMTWPGIRPEPELMDHPVRGVSYTEAEQFAQWAGKHVPTEFEWEYAARGPEGFYFPWGDEWFRDASHANWGGKIVERYVPTTVPVNGDLRPTDLEEGATWAYDGASWCGVWHMLGNVAEWTSSWFAAYPDPDVQRSHEWMGEYVKVIRGAGLKDGEQLVLRLAARNYRGGGMKMPPVPANRFENVGFRCAWYGNPGQDQLETILSGVARARRVKREDLALDQWAGATAYLFAPDASAVENHVFVTGHAHSILLVPLTRLLPLTQKKPKVKKRNDLLKWSSDPEQEDPIPLALFHTDVELTKVYVLDQEAMAKQAEESKGGRRRRQKPKEPPVKEGTCQPGSYILAFWHGRLCVAQPSLEPVCFLSKGTIDSAFLDIKKVKPEQVKATTLELTPVADLLQIGFSMPVGGHGADDALRVVVDGVLLNTAKGALTEAGEWRVGAYRPMPPELIEAAKAAAQGKPADEGESGDAEKAPSKP